MANQNIPSGFVFFMDAFHKIAVAKGMRILNSESLGDGLKEAVAQYRRRCLTYENASRVYKAKKAWLHSLPKEPPQKPECADGVRDFLNALVVKGEPIETIENGVKLLIYRGDLPIFSLKPDGLLRRLTSQEINGYAGQFIFSQGWIRAGWSKNDSMESVLLQVSNLEALLNPKPPQQEAPAITPPAEIKQDKAPPRRARKRNNRYDWEDIFSQFSKMILEEGLPGPDIQDWQTKADVHRKLVEWYAEKYGDGTAPDENYLAKKLAPKWRELEK